MPDPEHQRIKNRLIDLKRRIDDLPYRPLGVVNQGSASFLGRVVSGGAIPSATDRYYLLEPVGRIPPPATEGATPAIAWKSHRIPVLVIGSKVPLAGDMIQAWYCGTRWVAEGSSVESAICNLTVTIIRANSCGAVGAVVTFTEQDTGLLVYTATITSPTGQVNFPDSIAGKTYIVNWSFFSLSGSFTTPGCGSPGISIANPPGSGLTINCIDPLPTLYLTDDLGTRQCYPTGACVPAGGLFNPFLDMLATLIPQGSCPVPSWNLFYSIFFPGTGCTGPPPGLSIGDTPFARGCSRPFSHSGVYPSNGGLHPLAGHSYTISE